MSTRQGDPIDPIFGKWNCAKKWLHSVLNHKTFDCRNRQTAPRYSYRVANGSTIWEFTTVASLNAGSLKPGHIDVDILCDPLQDPPEKNNIFTLPLHTELDNEHIVKIFSKVSVGFAHLGGGGGAARKKFKYSQILKQRCSAPRISLTTNTFSFRRNMSAPGPGRGSGCLTSKCSASALVPLNTVFGTLCPATCQMTSRSALQMWEGSRAGNDPSEKFSHHGWKPTSAFTFKTLC